MQAARTAPSRAWAPTHRMVLEYGGDGEPMVDAQLCQHHHPRVVHPPLNSEAVSARDLLISPTRPEHAPPGGRRVLVMCEVSHVYTPNARRSHDPRARFFYE